MPHNLPDFRYRAQLTELMDEPCSRDQLRGCLRDLARINRWTMASRPVLQWLDKFVDSTPALTEPLHILDVGCGYGDGLRRIERWAKARRLAVELSGLDQTLRRLRRRPVLPRAESAGSVQIFFISRQNGQFISWSVRCSRII
jgi:SAM-dependent methyltransferase